MADISISDLVTYKRLVAAGNDNIYYEDIDVAVGTMVELTTTAVGGQSSGAIDTSDNLNMFELLQKVFVVNGSNLRVADFINTKLTSNAEITTYLPSKGDILSQVQNGGDIAYMVVDYVSAWASSKHLIYGYAYYAGSATAFVTNKDVKNANGNIVIALANLTTVTAKPHWYDWTVYNGDTTTYGTMPNKAYLGCNYRGRPVISGDPEHPHQWYTARQFHPWDFAYVANDAQSPVKGGNADAGEIGDIIRALIPYKDDYLIFGCATSMWFLAGDAADGGTINEMDLTVGIFGANSWCFDGEGNLYFWGTNGLYKTTIPGTPKCISEIKLPNLVNETINSETIDPATHRIILAYDRVRAGILICITKLSDGTNSNYFYDLRTLDETGIGGFFPESYPNECGPYSLFYYAANDSDYRDLLVGCKDGYIRKFDESAKDDNIGGSNQAIDSYVKFGPLQIADDPKFEGKITGLDIISAGTLPSGGSSDSNDIGCKLYAADSAEKVIEKLAAGTNPNFSKTFVAAGRRRGSNIRRKLRGVYAGIELRNNTSGETWGFEQLLIDAVKSGRLK